MITILTVVQSGWGPTLRLLSERDDHRSLRGSSQVETVGDPIALALLPRDEPLLPLGSGMSLRVGGEYLLFYRRLGLSPDPRVEVISKVGHQ